MNNKAGTNAEIAFICLAIACFAATWGPTAWVVIGEIFPLPIRARGIGLSTASNWLWNTVCPSLSVTTETLLTLKQIIAIITPYMVGKEYGNLGPHGMHSVPNQFSVSGR